MNVHVGKHEHIRTHTHTQNNTVKAALIWKSQKLVKIVRLMHSSREFFLATRKLLHNKIGLIILKILHYMESSIQFQLQK